MAAIEFEVTVKSSLIRQDNMYSYPPPQSSEVGRY
jgi:hypothetical protein